MGLAVERARGESFCAEQAGGGSVLSEPFPRFDLGFSYVNGFSLPRLEPGYPVRAEIIEMRIRIGPMRSHCDAKIMPGGPGSFLVPKNHSSK